MFAMNKVVSIGLLLVSVVLFSCSKEHINQSASGQPSVTVSASTNPISPTSATMVQLVLPPSWNVTTPNASDFQSMTVEYEKVPGVISTVDMIVEVDEFEGHWRSAYIEQSFLTDFQLMPNFMVTNPEILGMYEVSTDPTECLQEVGCVNELCGGDDDKEDKYKECRRKKRRKKVWGVVKKVLVYIAIKALTQ